jgi:hypothetical protein
MGRETLTLPEHDVVMGKVAVFNGEIDRPLPILGVHEQLQMATSANPFQHLLVDAFGCFGRQLDAGAGYQRGHWAHCTAKDLPSDCLHSRKEHCVFSANWLSAL